MSMQLMVHAMHAKVGNPLRKLVLIKLADNANDHGECWPSYRHIADQCEISRRSVINHIDALVKAGFLQKTSRSGKCGDVANLYLLELGGASTAPGGASPALAGESPAPGGASPAPPPSESPAPHRTSHSSEPVKEATPLTPQGGNDAKSTRGEKPHSSAIHPRAAPQPKGAHPLPRDWLPSPQLVDWAREKQLALDLAYHTEAFCDYWRDRRTKKIDWDASWRIWMRRENEKSGGRNAGNRGYRRNPTPVERVRAANVRREREKAAANRTIDGTIG